MHENNQEVLDYFVVINHEEQYSIWPTFKKIPAGWRAIGKQGSKEDCLKYIEEVWTDMRPLSLREAQKNASYQPNPSFVQATAVNNEVELVDFLCQGDHSVIFESNLQELKESLKRDYIQLKFPNTRGGTALGLAIDQTKTNFKGTDLENGPNAVYIEGYLTLNDRDVGCIATIDLNSMMGQGHLYIVDSAQNFTF